tara:strand:+ start:2367 stop:3020 length:654 start_codon:yes stop_codon:yes gene_type:complete
MIELELLTTKEDGSKVYKPVELTVKKVTKNDKGVYGFVFNERPNEQDDTEWWNASSFIVKANPDIAKVSDGGTVFAQLVHAPQIDKETGQHNGKYWNNVAELHVTGQDQEEHPGSVEEVKTPHATPTAAAKIDSFPKNLQYNVDRDNKIIMQVVLKAQIDLVNALLSANPDVSGILPQFDLTLESEINKAKEMINEVWNKRTNISDWEIEENSENQD